MALTKSIQSGPTPMSNSSPTSLALRSAIRVGLASSLVLSCGGESAGASRGDSPAARISPIAPLHVAVSDEWAPRHTDEALVLAHENEYFRWYCWAAENPRDASR